MQIGESHIPALHASPPLYERFPNVNSISMLRAWSPGASLHLRAAASECLAFAFRAAPLWAHLTRVNVHCCPDVPIPDTVVRLSLCGKLEALLLPSRAVLSPAHLAPLAPLRSLRRLWVALPPGDEAVAALAPLTQLTGLRVAVCAPDGNEQQSPPAVTLPPALSNLRALRLQCQIDLEPSLPALRGLSYLHLGVEMLSADACSHLAALTALCWFACATVDLTDADAPPPGAATVFATRLEVSGYVESMRACLAWFPNLRALSCHYIVDADIAELALAPAMREINLRGGDYSGAGLLWLTQLTALEALCVEAPQDFGDADVIALASRGALRNLRRLELGAVPLLTDLSCAIIARFATQLTELDVWDAGGISSAGLCTAAMNAPALRRLVLGGERQALEIAQCREWLAALGIGVQIVWPAVARNEGPLDD